MASTTSSLLIPAPKNGLIITPSTISLLSKSSSFRDNCHQSNPSTKPSLLLLKTMVIPGSIIATLASSPWAMAAKQIAESPQEDNRGLALLLPLVPAVGWVLFNILQPALNQINKMRNEKAVIFGLGGLALYSALCVSLHPLPKRLLKARLLLVTRVCSLLLWQVQLQLQLLLR